MVVHVQAVDNSFVAFMVEAVPQLTVFQRWHNTLCQLELKCAVHWDVIRHKIAPLQHGCTFILYWALFCFDVSDVALPYIYLGERTKWKPEQWKDRAPRIWRYVLLWRLECPTWKLICSQMWTSHVKAVTLRVAKLGNCLKTNTCAQASTQSVHVLCTSLGTPVFEVPYRWISIKGGAHMHFVAAWIANKSTMCI